MNDELPDEERSAHAAKLAAIGRPITRAIVGGKLVSVLDVLVQGQQVREGEAAAQASLEELRAKGEVAPLADTKAQDIAERRDMLKHGFQYLRHQNGAERFRRIKQAARVAGLAARRTAAGDADVLRAGGDAVLRKRAWDRSLAVAWEAHAAILPAGLNPNGIAQVRARFYGD